MRHHQFSGPQPARERSHRRTIATGLEKVGSSREGITSHNVHNWSTPDRQLLQPGSSELTGQRQSQRHQPVAADPETVKTRDCLPHTPRPIETTTAAAPPSTPLSFSEIPTSSASQRTGSKSGDENDFKRRYTSEDHFLGGSIVSTTDRRSTAVLSRSFKDRSAKTFEASSGPASDTNFLIISLST